MPIRARGGVDGRPSEGRGGLRARTNDTDVDGRPVPDLEGEGAPGRGTGRDTGLLSCWDAVPGRAGAYFGRQKWT